MISKQEILQIATNTNLSAQVIEKDYVLGWLLAGIGKNEKLNNTWVFKGGTCLKKCYFETYRFSEDLDFTLQDRSQLDEKFLRDTFSEIADWLYETTGIELPIDRMIFEQHKDGSCQGRIFYRGPVTPTSPRQMPRIKLDLTVEEVIVEPLVVNLVNHTYTDIPINGIQVQCYSYEEVFAEKIRALAQRTRPRDLYDVINFYRRPESVQLARKVRQILERKCTFKNIQLPYYQDLDNHKNACLAGWNDQLGHQLQALPPFESFWNELPKFFDWLYESPKASGTIPEAIPLQPGSIHERVSFDIWLDNSGTANLGMLDKIRFASTNHLCVEIEYRREDLQQKTYVIEPYSLCQTTDNHLLLYSLKHSTKEIRAFRTDRILSAKITDQPFIPSYRIEFLSDELRKNI